MFSLIALTLCIIAIVFACNLLWNYVLVCIVSALLIAVINDLLDIFRKD